MEKGEDIMEKDVLLEKIEMDCPICGEQHLLEKHSRVSRTIIKDERVEFNEVYFLCSNAIGSDYCEFVPGSLLNENLLNARNEYRKNHGLLTSDEIKNIRLAYDLTQAELSLILGMGEVTISRFETKAIQTKVLDEAIREARDNRAGFLKKLYAKRDAFTTERFAEIEACIRQLIIDETPVNSIQTITLSQLTESNFRKYEVFSCQAFIENSSADYDLLPPQKNVNVSKSNYYAQAQCEDSTFYNAAA